MTTELQDPRIVEYDVRTDEMLVNMGPQHPSTHGVLRLLLRTDGEIVNYGPNIMLGYWNNPEATAEVMTEDGGFRTGDLGRLDDGFLMITGRVKEQFKLQNGKYVAPSPLEESLKLSALVEQCCVDGSNKVRTFTILHPNEYALRDALKAAGLNSSGDFSDLCAA